MSILLLWKLASRYPIWNNFDNRIDQRLAKHLLLQISNILFNNKLKIFVSVNGIVGVVQFFESVHIFLMHVFDVFACRIIYFFNRNRFSDDDRQSPPIRNDAVVVLKDSSTEEKNWRKAPKLFNKFLKSTKLWTWKFSDFKI